MGDAHPTGLTGGLFLKNWSGRADLNGRPLAPQASALTRLRYAPTEIARQAESVSDRRARFKVSKIPQSSREIFEQVEDVFPYLTDQRFRFGRYNYRLLPLASLFQHQLFAGTLDGEFFLFTQVIDAIDDFDVFPGIGSVAAPVLFGFEDIEFLFPVSQYIWFQTSDLGDFTYRVVELFGAFAFWHGMSPR